MIDIFQAANILSHAAHHEEESTVKYEAMLYYRAHSHGDKTDVRYEYAEYG